MIWRLAITSWLLLGIAAVAQIAPLPGMGPQSLFTSSASYATWNPATVTNSGVLSAGNLKFTFSGGSGNVARGSKGTTGKAYYELTVNACTCGAGYFGFGAIDNSQATLTPANVAAVSAKMWEWRDDDLKINNGSSASYGSGFSSSAVLSVAIDNSLGSGSGKIWWGVCSAGTVAWASSGNPATGANAGFSNLTGTINAFINFFGSNGSPAGTANFGPSFACTLPSGFGAF